MTDKEIIQMAHKAGYSTGVATHDAELLKRFAGLVAAAECKKCDQLLEHIREWAEAYPLSIFPEPDFGKAHKVLTENGMTLDAISASNMRHVITQIKEMVNAAIFARGRNE